jgi:hypothetical protein
MVQRHMSRRNGVDERVHGEASQPLCSSLATDTTIWNMRDWGVTNEMQMSKACIIVSKKRRRNSTISTVPDKFVRGILAHVLTPARMQREQPTRPELEGMVCRNHRVASSRSVRAHSHELGW